MSVHKHRTHKGWYVVMCRPEGRSGKQQSITVKEGEERAHEIDQQIKKAARGSRTPTAFPIITDTFLNYLKYYSLDHLDTTNVTRSLRRWRLRAERKKPWILCE